MTTAVLNVGVLASPIFFTQSGAQRTALENLADISTIIIALAILTLLGLLISIVNETRQGQRKVVSFIEQLRGDLAPALKNVNELSTNLVHVSDAVSRRVDSVDDTIELANARLRSSVELAYRRVRHFDALLEVAQEEAEGLFYTAASAVRGVKRGAQTISGRDGRRAGKGPPPIDDEDDDFDLDDNNARGDNGDRGAADDGDRLWDDELEQVIGADEASDAGHPLTSSEQGPTIHRRRPRNRGPR